MKKMFVLLGILIFIGVLGFYMYNKDDHTNECIPQEEVKETAVKIIDSNGITFEKAYYDYRGSINKDDAIWMSLYPLGDEMVGSYIDTKRNKEMQLKGELKGQKIILYAFDEDGKNIGTFEGNMTTIDHIEGVYVDRDGKKKEPFQLELLQMIYAEYGKRYAVAGAESDEEVENFARKIQKHIIHDNKELIAYLVQYPTVVKIDGKNVEIKNKQDFIKNYNKIFYPAFKEKMKEALPKYMFANAEGIMFGEGLMNIWFGVYYEGGKLVLRIKKINN